MKTTKSLGVSNFEQNIQALTDGKCSVNDIIFLDIETTGLSPSTCSIYLIGTIYYAPAQDSNEHQLLATQLLAENESMEAAILSDFSMLIEDKTTFIHFNGNTFDLPFIAARLRYHHIDVDISRFGSIDLYKCISPFRHILGLSSCRQKNLEQLLGINREDRYTGGELIKVYREYVQTHDSNLLQLLITHNYEDLTGMPDLIPLVYISCIFHGENISADRAVINSYCDYEGQSLRELLIFLETKYPLPVHISYSCNDCQLLGEGSRVMLRIPIYTGEMKLFYSNYKDYYYLPVEDEAVHKSLARYVSSDFREAATARSCYTRVTGDFLPQFGRLFTPSYQKDYDSPLLFFKPEEGFEENKDRLLEYAVHILKMLKKGR